MFGALHLPMAVYLISFEVENPEETQAPLENTIRSLGDWGRLSPNGYIVHSFETQQAVYDTLAEKTGPQDTLYVLPLRRPWIGKGPKELDQWLEEILPY